MNTICTEMPEKVWHCSEWYPHKLVDTYIRRMIMSGKKPPSAKAVESVITELKEKVIANGGLSAQRPIDFKSVIERLNNT